MPCPTSTLPSRLRALDAPRARLFGPTRGRRAAHAAAAAPTRPDAPDTSDPAAVLPPAPAPHHSLATFLSHARRTGLDRRSTTYAGTRYEYVAQRALARLGFALTRTGGRADAGIDLLGTWALPAPPPAAAATTAAAAAVAPLRCLVQCKALARKVGPQAVRELEGAFASAPAGWRGAAGVGVLCAAREASRGVREAVRRSPRGLVWVFVDEGQWEEEGEGEEGVTGGRVRQMLWNDRVAEMGAAGVDVGLRYVSGSESGGVDREVVLTCQGEVREPQSATT